VRLRALLLAVALLAVPASASAGVDASGPRRLDVPRELRVVSYYPSDAGWTRMWDPWRPDRIAADLRRLRGLNANAVRIVVPAHRFGYPVPRHRYLERLRELVGIAGRSGLHVQFTLFDWWGDYGDVDGSKRWASAVLRPYRGDPRLAFVELRNEIDSGDPKALAWARELLPWLRAYLRGTPVTLSVGGVEPHGDLRALVGALPRTARPDFFTAHYFTGGGEQAERVFSELRQIASPTPLWIGELGYPTSSTVTGYSGVPLTSSGQDAAQQHFLRVTFTAAQRARLPAPGIWILDDFAAGAIPDSDVHTREPEYRFGLFRTDRSPKPAAATLRALFDGRLDVGFNGGFEAAATDTDGAAVAAIWGGGGGLRLLYDRTSPRSGRAAALLDTATGSGAAVVTPVTTAVRRNRTAEVTAWLRGDGGPVRVSVVWYDGSDRRIAETSAAVAPTADWQRLRAAGRPPARAEYVRIVVRPSGAEGRRWLDDVSFVWR
jgi:hypothetical protein